jgi:hypothetical protein
MRIPQLHLVRNSPRHSAERGPPATEIARQVGTCNFKKWLANSKSGLVTALLDHDSPAVQGVDEGRVDLTGDSDGLNLPETANLQDGSGSPRELRSFTTGIFFTAHSVRGILPSGSTAIRSVFTFYRTAGCNHCSSNGSTQDQLEDGPHNLKYYC